MRCAVEIKLSDEERLVLERRIRARRSMTRDALRARIVLLAAAGDTNKEIATKLAVKEHTVAKWRKRFVRQRMEGLAEHGGRGRKRLYTAEKVAEVIEATGRGKGATHLLPQGESTCVLHLCLSLPCLLRRRLPLPIRRWLPTQSGSVPLLSSAQSAPRSRPHRWCSDLMTHRGGQLRLTPPWRHRYPQSLKWFHSSQELPSRGV